MSELDDTTPEEDSHHPSKEKLKHLTEPARFPRGKNIPLPPCAGPKLYPFRLYGMVEDIEWVQEVAVIEMSAVWKVRIDGCFYALKLFGFPILSDICMPSECSLDYLRLHFLHKDSFHSECRAYGRPKETGNEHIVVPCHGYVLLTAEQEDAFRHLSNRLPEGLERPSWYNEVPVRGLIKDWMEAPESFTPDMIPRMIRDVRTINSLGIITRDIKKNNYLDGKLFDFGISWTVPRFKLNELVEGVRIAEESKDTRRIWSAMKSLHRELQSDSWKLDRMIDEWNKEGNHPWIWPRSLPNADYTDKLRPNNHVVNWDTYTIHNPLQYNWARIPRRDQIRGGRITKDSSKRKRYKKRTCREKKGKKFCTVS